MTGLILRVMIAAIVTLCLCSCAVTVPIGDRAKFGEVTIAYRLPDNPEFDALRTVTIGDK